MMPASRVVRWELGGVPSDEFHRYAYEWDAGAKSLPFLEYHVHWLFICSTCDVTQYRWFIVVSILPLLLSPLPCFFFFFFFMEIYGRWNTIS